MQLLAGVEQFTLNFLPSVEIDIAGYEVFATPGGADFTPSADNRKYRGPNTSITVPVAAGVWGIKVAAYDVFGDTDLNYTALMTCTVVATVAFLLEQLAHEVTTDQLNIDLNERIDLIDTPGTGLVDVAGELHSDIHDPETGLVVKTDGIYSSIHDPATGLIQKQVAMETTVLDPVNGVVKHQTDLQATVGDNYVALQVEQLVRASTTGPKWVTGTSYNKGAVVIYMVGDTPYLFQGQTAANTAVPSVISGVPQTTDNWRPVTANLWGEMMLKIDINGHIIGIGMSNDGVTGNVEILADKFSIVDPSDSEVTLVPFIVTGGVVYIKNAAIQNAAVDTLKIAGNSVSLFASGTGTTGTVNSPLWVAFMNTGYIWVPAGMTVSGIVSGVTLIKYDPTGSMIMSGKTEIKTTLPTDDPSYDGLFSVVTSILDTCDFTSPSMTRSNTDSWETLVGSKIPIAQSMPFTYTNPSSTAPVAIIGVFSICQYDSLGQDFSIVRANAHILARMR